MKIPMKLTLRRNILGQGWIGWNEVLEMVEWFTLRHEEIYALAFGWTIQLWYRCVVVLTH